MRPARVLPAIATLLIAFLYLPIAIVVLYAFNSGGNLTWPPKGFSLRWFEEILGDAAFTAALGASAEVALMSTIVATVVAVTAALVLARQRWWLTALVEGASLLPAMLPPLLIGVALLTTIAAFEVELSLWTVVAGHVIYVLPYVLVVVVARLRAFDVTLEHAARDLGAGPLTVLRRVTLPVVGPAVTGAALLSFGLSFDEVYITNFTVGDDPTLPLLVLSKLRRTVDPSINAVATILLLVPWIALGLSALILQRSVTRRRRATQDARPWEF